MRHRIDFTARLSYERWSAIGSAKLAIKQKPKTNQKANKAKPHKKNSQNQTQPQASLSSPDMINSSDDLCITKMSDQSKKRAQPTFTLRLPNNDVWESTQTLSGNPSSPEPGAKTTNTHHRKETRHNSSPGTARLGWFAVKQVSENAFSENFEVVYLFGWETQARYCGILEESWIRWFASCMNLTAMQYFQQSTFSTSDNTESPSRCDSNCGLPWLGNASKVKVEEVDIFVHRCISACHVVLRLDGVSFLSTLRILVRSSKNNLAPFGSG